MTQPRGALDLIRCVALQLERDANRTPAGEGRAATVKHLRDLADDLWRAFDQVEAMADAAYLAVDAYEMSRPGEDLSELVSVLHQNHLRLNFGRPEYRTWTDPIPGGWT